MKDMLGREELIPVEKALGLLLREAPFKTPEEIKLPIGQSYRRVLSRNVISPEDLPSFSRSTVDGFAVNASDTFGVTEGMPSYLNIVAEILMGAKPGTALKKGECAAIPTGGMLPEGADSVVMFEHTQRISEEMIEILKPVSPGEQVIQAGEDAKRDEVILGRGHRLKPQDIGALAGLGITEIWVCGAPRVSIISTGDEIVAADKTIEPGQVRDINSYTLAGLISESGGLPVRRGIFDDTYELIRNAVESALNDSEMVLISGGSSVGAKDMTSRVINDVGKPGVLFHGVALKPGKPTIGGIVDHIPIFGLPGHPAAVSVCFEVFIRPLLKLQAGMKEERFETQRRVVKARIARNISSSPGREEHIGVVLEEREGELWAIPLLGKSGLITTLTKADGTALVPLKKLGIHEGEIVEVRLFDQG